MKISKTQHEALDSLLRLDGTTDAPGCLGSWRVSTHRRLLALGLVDYELVGAYTWAQANRPRLRYYRLTEAGKAVVLARRAAKAAAFEALMNS